MGINENEQNRITRNLSFLNPLSEVTPILKYVVVLSLL
jgi:hypothetical protein